jgi:hypothetical protein
VYEECLTKARSQEVAAIRTQIVKGQPVMNIPLVRLSSDWIKESPKRLCWIRKTGRLLLLMMPMQRQSQTLSYSITGTLASYYGAKHEQKRIFW